MWRGLPASVILHSAVIFGGYIVWPFVSPPRTSEFVIVPVDLVTVSDTTNIAPSVRREPEPEEEPEEAPPEPEEEPVEEPEAVPDEEVVEEDTSPPPPPPEEEPEPEPEPDLDTPPVEEPEEEEEPEPEPKPEPKPEPEDDPLDDILGEASNLFDRAKKEERTAPPPKAEETPDTPAPSEQRRGVGDRRSSTVAVEALLTSQLYRCWRGVDDLPDPNRLVVTVNFDVNIDGSLKGGVDVVSPKRVIGDAYLRTAVERALTAVRSCDLRVPEGSEESYEAWKNVTVNFRPTQQ